MHYLDVNKNTWNAKTPIHIASAFYDMEGFLQGKTSLKSIELVQLGEVKGKKMLHLQCHFGQDSLSWTRMGAKVTGLDFSEVAIEYAQKLNEELGLDAKFVCSDVYEAANVLTEKYDIVYTSYGVLGWLPDMQKWAKVVANCLATGGELHLVEFHPVVWMFDNDITYIQYSYFNREVIIEEEEATYADKDASLTSTSVTWNHPLSDVVNALISAGLRIEILQEYDFSPYNCFPNTVPAPEGNFYLKDKERKMPLVYSIKAKKMG